MVMTYRKSRRRPITVQINLLAIAIGLACFAGLGILVLWALRP